MSRARVAPFRTSPSKSFRAAPAAREKPTGPFRSEGTKIRLDKTSVLSLSRQVPPLRTITAQNLSKAHRSASKLAALAARWLEGQFVIEQPTAALAAAICGCSQGSVDRALAEAHSSYFSAASLLNYYWWWALIAERAAFVAANANEVLIADHATAPVCVTAGNPRCRPDCRRGFICECRT